MKEARGFTIALLFLSGASGAVYALVWAGGAPCLVACALGAFAIGRLVDRLTRPLILYGLLQLGIGAFAALVPEPKLTAILPAFLAGGMLPAAFKHVTRNAGSMQSELARLVGASSLGAAAGVWLAGFWLIPAGGSRASVGFAIAVDVVIAVAALLTGRHRPPQGGTEGPAAPSDPQVDPPQWGLASLGLSAMLLKLAWFRLLTIVLGGSAYAFALMLTAWILALGLGSLWGSRREDRGAPLKLFAQLQLGMVAAVVLTFPLYTRLPQLFWVSHDLLARTRDTWPIYQALSFGCCGALVIPAFFIGAAFPVGARAGLGTLAQAGRRLGSACAWTLVGAVVGGWLLTSSNPTEQSIVLAVLATTLSVLVVLVRRRGLVVAALAAAIVLLASVSGWSHTLARMGAFAETGRPFGSFADYLKSTEVDLYAADSVASVVVSHDPANPKNQVLRINGKIETSTAPEQLETPILLGHLGPLLATRAPRRVLVLGGGSPLTIVSVLTHDVEHLDLVEISPAVLEGARLLGVADPRVRVVAADARAFLAHASNQYDLVVTVPGNAWLPTTAALFTREFYQAAAAHLEPDGVLVQAFHFSDSSEPLVQTMLRTLRDTFAHSSTWGTDVDLLTVSSRRPPALDFEELARRMAGPKVRDDLARIHVDRVVALLAKQVHTSAGQLAFAGAGPINTDDRNLLKWGAARAFFLRARRIEPGDQRRRPPGQQLWIEGYLQGHPASADDARAIYRNLSLFQPKDDPLVRAAAEKWLELGPGDPEARAASAKLALVHGDVATALTRLGHEPGVMASTGFLEAQRAAISCCRTVWSEVGLARVPPRPLPPDARRAWDAVCELAAIEGCE